MKKVALLLTLMLLVWTADAGKKESKHGRAHPIYILSPAKEEANMETLLERLHEKISLMEELQDKAILEDPEIQKGSQAEFPSDSFDRQPQPRRESRSYYSKQLMRMRTLWAPNGMRESGCFGRRLDRIGSASGMGCRGISTNQDKKKDQKKDKKKDQKKDKKKGKKKDQKKGKNKGKKKDQKKGKNKGKKKDQKKGQRKDKKKDKKKDQKKDKKKDKNKGKK